MWFLLSPLAIASNVAASARVNAGVAIRTSGVATIRGKGMLMGRYGFVYGRLMPVCVVSQVATAVTAR